ncbi:MAG: hypothetical protein KZQ63_00735 [Candidatus Thiodiazotropha sp. (ex Lucinoma aequizonata)]|nr:hypothetical protein [Candidatus Thiodiazotropha sp. (ex Lucinoma aequizonata)]
MGYNFGNNQHGGTKLFESQDGVVIRATSTVGSLADDDNVKGYFMYVVD